jgi:hypothetical protein
MNLKEIRDAMFAQADWAPTQSSEATSRVNNFINRAYNQLALEAPFLFFESKVHLATEPDVTSKDGGTLLGVALTDTVGLAGANTLPGSPTTRDPWTWRTSYTSDQQKGLTSGLTAWEHDRSWDGRMIEITGSDGTRVRNQIRSVWHNDSDKYYYFTLVTPWNIAKHGQSGLKYRIFTEAYPLPDDLVQLFSARLRDEDNNYPLDVFGQREAESLQLDGPPNQVTSGIPRVVFRRSHLHLQGPSVSPLASAALAANVRPPPNTNVPPDKDPGDNDPPGGGGGGGGGTQDDPPDNNGGGGNPFDPQTDNIPFDPKFDPNDTTWTTDILDPNGGLPTFVGDNTMVSLDFSDAAKSPPVSTKGSGSEAVAVEWLGPEPAGTFEYKVTYTWGKRDAEFQLPGLGHWEGFAQPLGITESDALFPSKTEDAAAGGAAESRNRFRSPRFESPPSPASGAMTNVISGGKTAAIKLSLPNITYALGFLNKITSGATTYTRQSLNQSGVYIRVYRRRIATYLKNYGELTLQAEGLGTSQLDKADDFYLLSEFRADSSNGGVWYDNGEILPDYSRRLRDIHGYQSMQFYPKPDQRYVVEVRGVVRPMTLVDSDDTPLIHAEAMDVLIEKAMTYLYENMGQATRSEQSAARYERLLYTLTKRYGDLRPPAAPVLRTMTRATGFRTNRRWNRRLTSNDLGGVVDG